MSLFAPIKSRKMRHFNFTDLTPSGASTSANQFMQDVDRKLESVVQSIGNLDLTPIDRSGLGDLVATIDWLYHFRQDAKHFRNITLRVKAGVSFPTAREKDEDLAFDVPLGNDGAWGLPYGFSASVEPVNNIKVGLDVEFLSLLSHTRTRRLKTHPDQTEFLLLNKGRAQKDYGLTYEVSPYVQLFAYEDVLSVKLAYQYTGHSKDKLKLKDAAFDTQITTRLTTPGDLGAVAGYTSAQQVINSANSLRKWSSHNLLLMVNLDLTRGNHHFPGAQLSFFFKPAITGKHLIDNNTIGGQLALSF